MSCIDNLSYALVHAVQQALLPMEHYKRQRNKEGMLVETDQVVQTRPREDHCEVSHFQQTWPSTALGFGGIGGQAFTNAYTTVVRGPQGDAAVYFAGRFAYHLNAPNQVFFDALANRAMPHRHEAHTLEAQPEGQGA